MILFLKQSQVPIRFGAITRGSNSTKYILFINLPGIEFYLKFRTTSVKQFVYTREWNHALSLFSTYFGANITNIK